MGFDQREGGGGHGLGIKVHPGSGDGFLFHEGLFLGVPDPLAQGDPIRFMKIEGSQIKSRAKDNAEDVASGSGIGGKPANHLGGKLSAIVERNMLGME